MCPDPFLRNGSHLPEAVTLGSQGLPFLPVFVSETWLYSIVLKAWSGDWQRWNKGNSNIWGYGDQEAGLSSSFCFQLEPLNELLLPLTPLTTHVLQLYSDHLSSWPSLLSCTSFRASYCCSPRALLLAMLVTFILCVACWHWSLPHPTGLLQMDHLFSVGLIVAVFPPCLL